MTNDGVARYRGLDGRHLATAEASVDGTSSRWTRRRPVEDPIGWPRATACWSTASHTSPRLSPVVEPGFAAVDLALVMEPGQPVTVEKLAALCTSRDRAIGEPERGSSATRSTGRATSTTSSPGTSWPGTTSGSGATWRSRVRSGHLILRLHVFHLLQTVSSHSIDLDAGIPARACTVRPTAATSSGTRCSSCS